MGYPTVSFVLATPEMGLQPIGNTETTQNHPLGKVVKAKDVNYGEGQFIYLAGVASTAAGDVVFYDQKAGTTVRAVHGGTGSNGPAAVAMSANSSTTNYGWYCIQGSVPVNTATGASNAAVYLTSTAGQVDNAIVGGDRLDGIYFKAAASGGFATCQLSGPCLSDETSSGTNTGDVTLGAVGSSPSANGASLAGQVLTLQPVDGTHPGVLTTGSQTIAGSKSLTGTTTLTQALLVDAQPTSGSGTGVTVAYSGRALSGWYKVTVDKTAWVAAALTQDITLLTLPAKGQIVSVVADTTIAYAGLSGTIAIKIGATVGGGEVLASHDVKTATVTKGLADADLGTSMVRASAVQGGYIPSWSATTNITARLTSGTGNIGSGTVTNLTTGSTTYYFQVELAT